MNGLHQPKRILMTADTVGGVWVYALELSREFGRLGLEVALATMGRPLTRDQREEAGSCPGLQLYESDYKLEWMDDPWRDVDRSGNWLLGLEAELEPDLVHLNSYAHGALPWEAPVLVAGHSCVLSWFRAVRRKETPSHWKRYRVRATAGLQSADLVVAPSRFMLNSLEQDYGPLPKKRVIHNSRSLKCREHRFKDHLILGAGRLWDEAKNLSALADAAADLPWPVCIAGEGKHPDRQGVEDALSAKNVNYLGRLPSSGLLKWYERAAIYALPARYEPFGLSVLEAAHHSCALVLGDIPSLRELWNDAAIFVPPDDGDALRAALRRLIEDAPLRAALGSQAQSHAGRYDTCAMAENYLNAYAEAQQARELGPGAISTRPGPILPIQPFRAQQGTAATL